MVRPWCGEWQVYRAPHTKLGVSGHKVCPITAPTRAHGRLRARGQVLASLNHPLSIYGWRNARCDGFVEGDNSKALSIETAVTQQIAERSKRRMRRDCYPLSLQYQDHAQVS